MIKKMLRTRRWFLIATAFLALAFLAATAVYAQDTIKVIVNGKEVTGDVSPQIVNGRTLVSLRIVAEALGAKVDWDAQNKERDHHPE